MLIGCGDCLQSGQCQYKVLTAVILASDTPDGTGSYCPGVYNCTGGDCVATCGSVQNMINWMLTQAANFQNDSLFPWNQCAYAIFSSTSDTSPSSVTGPGPTDCNYGGPGFGSGYATGTPVTAQDGPAIGGNLCAIVNMVGLKMTGTLYLSPQEVYGGASQGDPVTEACVMQSTAPCSPSDSQLGIYYPPLPPYDLCGNLDGPFSDGFQIQYYPYASGPCAVSGVLNGWSGGASVPCQSPDPFFGDDPP